MRKKGEQPEGDHASRQANTGVPFSREIPWSQPPQSPVVQKGIFCRDTNLRGNYLPHDNPFQTVTSSGGSDNPGLKFS